MNEDGTFILENITTYKTSIAMRDTFEGEYILEDDILTLKWHGFEVPFLYIDGKIYFDIIVKVQTGETVSPMKVIDEALQGAWVHEDTTITFADGRFTYDYIRVSDGEREVNEGDYKIGPATITLAYDSGVDPELDYTFEDGVLSLFGEKGIPPVQFNYIKQE